MDARGWHRYIDRILFSVVAGYAFCVLGYFLVLHPEPDLPLGPGGNSVTVRGIVADTPDARPDGVRFTLDAGKYGLIVDGGRADISYGDEVEATGAIELPENFMTDQGMEFDYVSYLYKDNILYKMQNANVSVLSHGHGNWLVAKLIPVKAAIVRSFHRALPGNDADLLAGLDLGEKGGISNEFRDELVTTGTIHIIALSGYNVTILANALRAFFLIVLKVSERAAAMGGALIIVLFVVMTGLQSSAIRAGIMALIGIFAREQGRTYSAFRALVFAGFVMILYNPRYLVYDVSFQLSFLATLGLIFLTPIFERKLARVPKKILLVVPLRELAATTLGAQVGVLPFILYKMGTLSLIALPANVAVLPTIPFAMGIGAFSGLVASFSPLLATPFSLASHLLLAYIQNTVHFFAQVPYAAVMIRHFPLWLCLAMYLLMMAWVRNSYKHRPSPAQKK